MFYLYYMIIILSMNIYCFVNMYLDCFTLLFTNTSFNVLMYIIKINKY